MRGDLLRLRSAFPSFWYDGLWMWSSQPSGACCAPFHKFSSDRLSADVTWFLETPWKLLIALLTKNQHLWPSGFFPLKTIILMRLFYWSDSDKKTLCNHNTPWRSSEHQLPGIMNILGASKVLLELSCIKVSGNECYQIARNSSPILSKRLWRTNLHTLIDRHITI